jgi:capsular polysaccharide biosynthesis protein
MELTDYFRILYKRWWIVVVLLVVTSASAFVFSKLQTPIYKSTMQVTVMPARNDLGLSQTTTQLLRAYVSIIYSKTWAAKVLNRFEQGGQPLDTTPENLKSNVVIASFEDRNVIQIDVKDFDGEQANRIAKTWAEEFKIWRDQENQKVRKEDRVDVILGDDPVYSQYRPQTKLNVAAGGILGLLLAGVVIFCLEWIESGIVRTTQDVERRLGLTVLGAIPSGAGTRGGE